MHARHHDPPGNNPTLGGCSRTRPLEQPRRLRLFPGTPGNTRRRFNACWMKVRNRFFVVAVFVVTLSGCEKKNMMSSSMSPTIKPGERLTIDYSAYAVGRPSRWDVVVFEPPMFTNELWAMRVVALPAETVSVSSKGITINGHPMSLPAKLTYVTYVSAGTFGQGYVVPNGCDYVLGDNSQNANDSRYWGALPLSNIVGRVRGK